MRTKGKLNYIRSVPVLLFAGVQMFAQAEADSRMAGRSVLLQHQMTSPLADMS